MNTLADRYRPAALAEIIGQPVAVASLRAWLSSPKSKAWLFHGPPGTGKTSCALALAAELGCGLAEREMGGLFVIPSGEQTADSVRERLTNLRFTPFYGTGWKVCIVNEADYCSPTAAMVWLDGLENLPPRTVIVFTTNDPAKLTRRFRDRCEQILFAAPAADPRTIHAAQSLIDRVWQAELGHNHAPTVADMPEAIEDGQLSYRGILQALEPRIRAELNPNTTEENNEMTMQDLRAAVAANPTLAKLNPDFAPPKPVEFQPEPVEDKPKPDLQRVQKRESAVWDWVAPGTVLLHTGTRSQTRWFVLPADHADAKLFEIDARKWAAEEVTYAEAYRHKNNEPVNPAKGN